MLDVSRRRFLQWTGLAALTSSFESACARPAAVWSQARLVLGYQADTVERSAADDAAALLSRALGTDASVTDRDRGRPLATGRHPRRNPGYL